MKIIDSVTGNENAFFRSQGNTSLPRNAWRVLKASAREAKKHKLSCQKFTYPLKRWQQPYTPEDSSQMLVPSEHWYFWSGEKTSPEVPMKPFLFDAVSSCCEGMTLLTFASITTVPSRQRWSVLLTNIMACTRNADEPFIARHVLCPPQRNPGGQQVLWSGQHWAPSPA